jgi:HK97 family phage major capsid protein
MSEDTEKVEVAPEAIDQIAERVVGLLSAKADEAAEDPQIKALTDRIAELETKAAKPARSELEEAGTKAKPGDASPAYGGDDAYTLTGETDADVAVAMYLTQELLQGSSNGRKTLSPRGRDVMVKAAEKALKSAPAPIAAPTARDRGALIKSHYAISRAEAYKAMTSTTANAGDEWVPTFALAELWRDVHLATSVAAQVRRVDMPTNPYDLPIETGDPTFYYASSENTAVTASNVTTDKATLTAKKIQAEVDFSGELTEDSIIPIVPNLRFSLVRRGAQVIDDLIVHGDTVTAATGNVNSDDAAPAAGSFYLALGGMRKFCITTNTGQLKQFSAAPSTTLFLNTRALLGRYGARATDLICIMPFTTQNSFADVTGFKLVSEIGPQASVVQGEVAKVFNTPVFLSEAIPGTTTDKVDTDGKYTTTSPSSADTKGWFVLANPNEWVTGFRRGFQIESFRDIQKDQNILVASFRMALIPSGHATTHTAVGYNLTVL